MGIDESFNVLSGSKGAQLEQTKSDQPCWSK